MKSCPIPQPFDRREIATYLLSKGAEVNAVGGELQSTPLQWAVRQGHVSMVVLLMRHGADPSILDGEGCAGIHLAAQVLPVNPYLKIKYRMT